MKKITLGLASLALVFGLIGLVGAEQNAVTPSTNDINRENNWAHVNQLSIDIGTTDLEFVSTRSFLSCFEYRTDGDTSQALETANPNTSIDDRYPHLCVNNSTTTQTFTADEYVEIRMVFGAERDERFDWTRFDILPEPGVIVSPEADEEITQGNPLSLEAKDIGAKNGNVQWAVRFNTCTANTNTIAGNVDGFNTPYQWLNGIFTASLDTTNFDLGEYCFVFNPNQGDRLTQLFEIVAPDTINLETKEQCMKGGWEAFGFRNQGQCIRFIETNKDSR